MERGGHRQGRALVTIDAPPEPGRAAARAAWDDDVDLGFCIRLNPVPRSSALSAEHSPIRLRLRY